MTKVSIQTIIVMPGIQECYCQYHKKKRENNENCKDTNCEHK